MLKSKTAFTFERGTQKICAAKWRNAKMKDFHMFPAFQVKSDRYSDVRTVHNYRNITRAARQFLLGDPYAEQLMVTMLRKEYLHPKEGFNHRLSDYTPFYRLMADHSDRHAALVANNQHPVQLGLYEQLNRKYREDAADAKARNGTGPLTFKVALDKRVE